MATIDEMRAEMAEIEKHMTHPGGGACDWQVFVGDCKDCERWYELDEIVLTLEWAQRNGETKDRQEGA